MSHRFPLLRAATRFALIAAFACSACLSPPPSYVGSADAQLEQLLVGLRDVRGGGFEREGPTGTQAAAMEGQLIREVRGLALAFPRHVPILVANASLAYERRDFVGAQKYLDQALQVDPVHREATLLRVRIAAEAGNLPYARRKLGEQLAYAPDDADLREAHSGVLYLLGDFDEALEELDVADRLREDGEGRWRTDYHRGLIAEARGELEEARDFYRESHEQNPDFEPAARRWRWLEGELGGDEEAQLTDGDAPGA